MDSCREVTGTRTKEFSEYPSIRHDCIFPTVPYKSQTPWSTVPACKEPPSTGVTAGKVGSNQEGKEERKWGPVCVCAVLEIVVVCSQGEREHDMLRGVRQEH
jgi:hypothetical protein